MVRQFYERIVETSGHKFVHCSGNSTSWRAQRPTYRAHLAVRDRFESNACDNYIAFTWGRCCRPWVAWTPVLLSCLAHLLRRHQWAARYRKHFDR